MKTTFALLKGHLKNSKTTQKKMFSLTFAVSRHALFVQALRSSLTFMPCSDDYPEQLGH